MSLPIILPVGAVLVYGPGVSSAPYGVEGYPPEDFLYANVYQVYDGGAVFVYGGDPVFFRRKDIREKYLYNDWPYLLIDQSKLVTQTPPL